ncbi:hypothetical protein CPC08DRAFT_749106 [Agrocybe pediades]|nr:hypothetical protein CPC08DRAFT_749106 [Agrocybe pediades]
MEKTLTDIFSDYVDRERGPASEHKRMCVLAHRLRSPSLVMTEIVTGDSRSDDSFAPTEIYEHAAERTTMSWNESMYISAPGPFPEPKTPSRGTSTLSDPSRAYPTPGTGRPRRETSVAPSAFNANNPSTPTPPGSFYASANSFNNNSIAHLSSSPLRRQPTLLDLERDRLSSDYDRQEEEIARLKRHITIVAAHYEKYKIEREKTVAIREAQIKELESRLEEQEKILAEMQQKITQEMAFSRQKSDDLKEFEAKYQDLRQKFLTYRDQHTSWLNALPKLPSDLV